MSARTRSPFVPAFPQGYAGWPDEPAAAAFRFPFRLLILLALLPLLFGVSLIAVYRQQQIDRVYPGVSVLGVSLGRMTRDRAIQAIKVQIVDESRRPFLLRYDDDAVSVTLAGMGLVVDDAQIAGLADTALAVGRDDNLRTWFQTQFGLLRLGYAVPATLHVDPERATAVLARVAVDVERPTFNAGIDVAKVGERYEIHTSPARTGRKLNVAATIDHLQSSLAGNLPKTLDLVLEEAPPGITDDDIAPATDALGHILEAPLVLKDGTRMWQLSTDAAFAMLEIGGLDSGHPPITAGLSQAKLRDFVEKTARAADQPAQNPSFAIDGDQIVVRPGASGKLADAGATFDQVQQAVGTATHSVDVVFKDDKPWLTDADLEPSRTQANALLSLPIIVEAPPGTVPATPGPATPRPTSTPLPSDVLPQTQAAEGVWVLDRRQLVQMITLPNTQSAPRDYATLPPAQRPRFEIQLDSAKVSSYLQREVAPWVSFDPTDAKLELTTAQLDLPNPAYAAAVAEQQRQAAATATAAAATATAAAATATAAARSTATPGARPTAEPTRAPAPITVPPTIKDTRYTVELRNASDGRGPDYQGTYAAMQVLFRSGATGVTPAGSAPPVDFQARRVTLRLAPRPPKVQDRDLVAARDLANRLIGEPVVLRWKDAAWTVTRAELADMLRYQSGSNGLTAYLTRDGLLAKAQAIAAEAERRSDAPRASDGKVLPLDVPATASAIWLQASTVPANRSAELVWTEEAPKLEA